MFYITEGKGFQIKFANGWTVSAQWGAGNYVDRHLSPVAERPSQLCSRQSPNAEIAAWDASGELHNFGADTVKGYCTPDEVATFIHMVSNFKENK